MQAKIRYFLGSAVVVAAGTMMGADCPAIQSPNPGLCVKIIHTCPSFNDSGYACAWTDCAGMGWATPGTRQITHTTWCANNQCFAYQGIWVNGVCKQDPNYSTLIDIYSVGGICGIVSEPCSAPGGTY